MITRLWFMAGLGGITLALLLLARCLKKRLADSDIRSTRSHLAYLP